MRGFKSRTTSATVHRKSQVTKHKSQTKHSTQNTNKDPSNICALCFVCVLPARRGVSAQAGNVWFVLFSSCPLLKLPKAWKDVDSSCFCVGYRISDRRSVCTRDVVDYRCGLSDVAECCGMTVLARLSFYSICRSTARRSQCAG